MGERDKAETVGCVWDREGRQRERDKREREMRDRRKRKRR